jgi:hypothetical protein
MTRDEAWQLLNEFTKSDSLIKHALAVEAAMRFYAMKFNEDIETWGITGLLHDFDCERWPNPPDHTREGAKILRDRGIPESQSTGINFEDFQTPLFSLFSMRTTTCCRCNRKLSPSANGDHLVGFDHLLHYSDSEAIQERKALKARDVP